MKTMFVPWLLPLLFSFSNPYEKTAPPVKKAAHSPSSSKNCGCLNGLEFFNKTNQVVTYLEVLTSDGLLHAVATQPIAPNQSYVFPEFGGDPAQQPGVGLRVNWNMASNLDPGSLNFTYPDGTSLCSNVAGQNNLSTYVPMLYVPHGCGYHSLVLKATVDCQ